MILPNPPSDRLLLVRDKGEVFQDGDFNRAEKAMAFALECWEDGMIAWSWRKSGTFDTMLHFLPASETRIGGPNRRYYALYRDRGPRDVPEQTPYETIRVRGSSAKVRFFRVEPHPHYHMQQLQELCTNGLGIQGMPWGDACILRRGSVIILRAIHEGHRDPGLIVFRRDATAHEVLEEIASLEADFPGRFTIEEGAQ